MYLSIKNTINKKYFDSEVGLQKILIAPKIDFVNRRLTENKNPSPHTKLLNLKL